MTGIEPAYSAWEADVLPLNYICILDYFITYISVCQTEIGLGCGSERSERNGARACTPEALAAGEGRRGCRTGAPLLKAGFSWGWEAEKSFADDISAKLKFAIISRFLHHEAKPAVLLIPLPYREAVFVECR